jgi:hypothetical protein
MRRSGAVLGCAVLFAFVGCHTITEELPSKPSSTNGPVVNVPVPVVVTPVDTPTPAAPSNPTPTPAPNPNPDPTPTPDGGGGGDGPSVGQSCASAPAGNERCGGESPDFLDAVDSALRQVVAKRPGWFQKDGATWRLVGTDEKTYDWAVIDQLRANGYCAGLYAEEVSVRKSSSYSENYDILTSNHTVRRGEGSYRSTCHPAAVTEE